MSSPMSRCSMVARLPTSVFTSITWGWRNCRRLKARSWRVSDAARSDARRICSTSWASPSPFRSTLLIRSLWPMITARRLLKSWAIPPARRPTASIFCACRSWASRRLRSEVSSRMASVPIVVPAASRSRASEKRHSTQRPSPRQDLRLVLPDAPFLAEASHQGPGRLPPAALELGDRPPHHLGGPVAQELLGAGAEVRDVAAHVGGDDARGRVLRDRAEEIPGAARVLVEPRVADRQRRLAREALEQLPVLGVELEGRGAVQREDAEQHALVHDRHDVRAPEPVLPEPVGREDPPILEDVRDDHGLAVRGDPARQPLAEPDAPARVRGAEPVVGERPHLERPGLLVGHPDADRRGLHQLRRGPRDLAEHLVQIERRGDEPRQPRHGPEPGEPPIGGRLLAAEPVELGRRRLPLHDDTPLRTPAPCIRSAGRGTRPPPPPRARTPGSSSSARRPRGSCTRDARSRRPA